jgi:hypothetical protein
MSPLTQAMISSTISACTGTTVASRQAIRDRAIVVGRTAFMVALRGWGFASF